MEFEIYHCCQSLQKGRGAGGNMWSHYNTKLQELSEREVSIMVTKQENTLLGLDALSNTVLSLGMAGLSDGEIN